MRWLDEELPDVNEIHRRLELAIPTELDPRGWGRREMAAKTVFTKLYGQAVEGEDRWLRPTAVTDMTDQQAQEQDPEVRRRWLDHVQSPKRPKHVKGRWYSENTREPIRDETLRFLREIGAVVERSGLPTTSPRPRYALEKSFARLFTSQLDQTEADQATSEWRERNLRQVDLARLALTRQGVATSDRPLVKLPTGETRRLATGPSSILSKAVVESFAPHFLVRPGVIMISESARKLTYQDRDLAASIGFEIDTSSTLPDLLLVDLREPEILFVFVECVVSDGEISRQRREELTALADAAGVPASQCAFVTAFADRSEAVFRKVASTISWGTFAWFASEPHHLIHFRHGGTKRMESLSELSQHRREPST